MDTLSLILIIIGALNWGLIGLFQFDLVAALFGNGSLQLVSVSSAVLIILISGSYALWLWKKGK